MTVYITQKPRPNTKNWEPNLTSAHQYGKLEFIFDTSDKVYALPGPSLFKARKALRNFNPDTDYILHINMTDPMALCVTMSALFKEFQAPLMSHINFLYFDRRIDGDGNRTAEGGVYYPVRLELKKAEVPWA